MKRTIISLVAFALLVCALGMGATGPATAKKKHAKAHGPTLAEQMQQLKDQVNQQQTQLQQQSGQIQQLQQQLQQSNQQLQDQNKQLQTSVQQANDQAAAAQQASNNLTSSVADLKTSTAAMSQTLDTTKKQVGELEHPLSIHYKGLELTPGGFLTADTIFRTRNENADATSSFANVPFGGVANSQLTEFRYTSRASRLSLLAEGKAGSTKFTGYYEMDYLSPSLSNYQEVNAWNPRVRQAWAQAEFSGVTLTAGQMWSLLTTDRKGIATRAEFIPSTIEASYVVGYSYVRQAALRLTAKVDNHFWAALEVANPETTSVLLHNPTPLFGFENSTNALSPNGNTINSLAGSCAVPAGAVVNGVTVTSTNDSTFVCNPAASAITPGLSTNLAPDVIIKLAFDPGWGHYEIKGLARFFRDRFNGSNNVSYGGGVGAAMILPFVPKKLDFIAEGLVGEGIGRYGATNSPDVTVNPSGIIVPLKAVHVLTGFELHPGPKLDIYAYGGDEYLEKSDYVNATGEGVGYGTPLVNNTNCNQDFAPSTAACGAQNKNIWDGTVGFWYRLYKGSYGTFQYGMQYEYLYRVTYPGTLGGAPATGIAPKGQDQVAYTSFRFFLP